MTPTTEPALTQTAFFAADEHRRIAELERALAERDKRIAELEPLARLALTLQRVALAEHWPARDRAILAALIARCEDVTRQASDIAKSGDPDAADKARKFLEQAGFSEPGAGFAELDLSAADVAALAGVGERTARDCLARLDAAGVVRRRIEHDRVSVNRFGAPIPYGAGDPDRGDRWHWQTAVTLSLPLALADLPPLPDTAYLKRARDKAAQARALLRSVTCPKCGTIGEWDIACSACGEHLTIGQDAGPDSETGENPGPVNFTAPAAERQASPAPDAPGPANFTAYLSDPANSAADALRGGGDISTIPEVVPDPAPPIAETVPDPGPANFAAPEIGPDSAPAPFAGYYLTGSDTVIHLADEGAAFCLIEPTKEPRGKCPINPRPADDDTADPIPWTDCPMTAAAARAHLERRGNVGHLTGYGNTIELDCDEGLPGLLQAWPELADAGVVYRADAPARAKFPVRIDGPLPASKTYEAPGRKVEILAAGRQGVIAGTHASGAELRFRIGPLPTVTAAELDARLAAFVDLPAPAPLDPDRTTRPAPSSVQSEPTTNRGANVAAANHAGDVKARILAWCTDPTNQAAVDNLLAGCRKAGRYVAIRPDDTHPSMARRTDHDGRRIWRDFGSGTNYDDLELFCVLTGADKRAVIREMLSQ